MMHIKHKKHCTEIQTYVQQQLNLKFTDLNQDRQAQMIQFICDIIDQYCYKHAKYRYLYQNQNLKTFIVNETFGLGVIDILNKDKSISEIIVNGPDRIFIEKQGKLHKLPYFFSSNVKLTSIVKKMLKHSQRRLDDTSPMIDAQLQDGSRLNAIIKPLAMNGTCITIRKFNQNILSISHLIQNKTLNEKMAHYLCQSVHNKKNILIIGGTGSGKTTLLNVLSGQINPTERIICIEDSAELQLQQDHVVSLQARKANSEKQGEITLHQLLINALRMRPDRIILGECRSYEIMDMLQCMNTGHEGSMTTLHANTCKDALKRIESMIYMSGYEIPIHAIRQLIVSSLDIIINIQRTSTGSRKIIEISEICNLEQNTITLNSIFKSSESQS